MTYLIVITTVLALLFFFAHYNFWRPKANPNFPRFLMYHSINTETNRIAKDLVVNPATFEKQLQYLSKRGYQFFTVTQLINEKPQGPTVSLTFDDGFRDNYTQLFPLLKYYGAKATIYLCPNIEGIERLSGKEIHEMQASGLVEFGAHTMHHVNLEKVTTEQANLEIQESKHAVEMLTGVDCNTFAYPYGRFNDTTISLVKERGFSSAVSVKKGIEAINNPYRIKRISILGSANLLQFHLAMTRGRYKV